MARALPLASKGVDPSAAPDKLARQARLVNRTAWDPESVMLHHAADWSQPYRAARRRDSRALRRERVTKQHRSRKVKNFAEANPVFPSGCRLINQHRMSPYFALRRTF